MRTLALILFAGISLPATADVKAGEKKAQICLTCHNPSQAQARWTPLLDAQPRSYLVAQTTAIKAGKRPAPGMGASNTARVSARDIEDIADYLSSRPPVVGASPVDPAKVETGDTRASQLKCATCHQTTYHGTDVVPRLAGQKPGYLVRQLEAFAEGRRPHPTADMPPASGEDIENIANYLASLK